MSIRVYKGQIKTAESNYFAQAIEKNLRLLNHIASLTTAL